MSSVNKVILLGHLGKDPELRYTPSGSAVCNFSIATNEYWIDKSGQKQERTEWHRIVVWNKQAEHCNQYLSKGRQIYLEGQLQTRSWDDAETGQKRYSTEIVARTVQFLGSRSQQDSFDAPTSHHGGNEGSYEGGRKNSDQAMDPLNHSGVIDKDHKIASDANFTADDIPF